MTVEAVHAMLDAALLCHIAYVIDGQPYCTPTHVLASWQQCHLARLGRQPMLKEQVKHIDVCLTVSYLDSIVLTRSAFGHSVNYRSAMLFGRASLIEDPGGEAARVAAGHRSLPAWAQRSASCRRRPRSSDR